MKCTCKHEVASKTFFTAFENKNPIHSRLESTSYTRQTWGFEPDCVLESLPSLVHSSSKRISGLISFDRAIFQAQFVIC